MSRLALFNLIIGFLWIALAASAGAILAFDLSDLYTNNQAFVSSWRIALQKSSHGHTNLFGLLEICFGLTLAYSTFGFRIKLLQTIGIFLGAVAMGPLMLMRSFGNPSTEIDALTILASVFLSCSLVAIFMHVLGLATKFFRR